MSLHYDKFEIVELLEDGVYAITYLDHDNLIKTRCLTLDRDIIGELDSMPIGFNSLKDAWDQSGNAFAALDVYAKEWHIVYMDRADKMRKHYDYGTV